MSALLLHRGRTPVITGPTLFGRQCDVTVGTLFLANLDVEFSVKKNLKAKPNTCDLKIWGLSPKSRKILESATQPQTKTINVPSFTLATGSGPTQTARLIPTPTKVPGGVPVRIDAGYQGLMGQIFLGELRSAQTVTEKAEIIVQLSTGDGDNALTRARASVPWLRDHPGDRPPPAPEDARRGPGESSEGARPPEEERRGPDVQQGRGIQGCVRGSYDGLLSFDGSGVERPGRQPPDPLPGPAPRRPSHSPDSGLIGSPSVDTKGVLSAVSLLNPSIKPGVKIVMDSRSVQGGFRVISVEYEGSRSDNDWYCKIEADRY